ncbi:hypothetical protein [Nocardia mexicana]|uniref:Uncharacterized protein n=1 Tax=Nocardia mexicana TaxID=279262 RepID=A0A370H3T6_9NOCA|nr:hypothetical protein [Nocardia mexicana]RDI50554.1 hypothetical protein DFR68_10530 [Nocardia mexicana]
MGGWNLPAPDTQRVQDAPGSDDGTARTVRMVVDAENWLRPVVVYDEAAILRAYAAALEKPR